MFLYSILANYCIMPLDIISALNLSSSTSNQILINIRNYISIILRDFHLKILKLTYLKVFSARSADNDSSLDKNSNIYFYRKEQNV